MAASRILLVEDDHSFGLFLKELLEMNGYSVQIEHDGASGLKAARQGAPQLLILDMMLPSINGIDVCRALKNDPATRATPVIMLTAMDRVADVDRAFAAGADDYLTKPCEKDRLLGKIRKALNPS